MGAFLIEHTWARGLVYGLVLATAFLVIAGWATWFERKFAGRMHSRLGPVDVGPFGLLQPLADAIKLMRKEILVPRNADRALFLIAPPLGFFLTVATLATVPVDDGVVVADLDIGLLWVLALSGLLVFPTWIAGWASNNKYALFGGMRAVAQGISYEVPMLLCAMVPVVMAQSFSISEIVQYQIDHGWLLWNPIGPGLIAFVIFFLTSLAEANRIPFDIPEAESELVAGVSVEYSAMLYGLFPTTEYVHTLIASAVAVALFLGGWDGPFAPGLHWMVLKTLALFAVIYWIRWSLVRFRADQLMRICWLWLVPISLLALCATAAWVGLSDAPVSVSSAVGSAVTSVKEVAP